MAQGVAQSWQQLARKESQPVNELFQPGQNQPASDQCHDLVQPPTTS